MSSALFEFARTNLIGGINCIMQYLLASWSIIIQKAPIKYFELKSKIPTAVLYLNSKVHPTYYYINKKLTVIVLLIQIDL